MKIIFHNCYEELNLNNRLFESDDTTIGDDLLRPFQILKDVALQNGLFVGTRAVIPLEQADAIVFVDLPDTSLPHVQRMIDSGKPLYLIVLESILIRPLDKNHILFRRCEKIFTYDDSMVDNKRIAKINYSFDMSKFIGIDCSKRDKLCVMIAGNKYVSHPQELYSKRIEAVRWFENNHPDEFDLFGVGWDEYNFGNKLPWRVLNRFRALKKLLAPRFPSYRGRVERKKPVLERYKFAICYENVKDVPGYITEKIFDCFFAGSVPVYWGADNITDYVPADCFIDKRKFANYQSLYDFLVTMSDADYAKYIHSISEYLSGAKAHRFSVECFASSVVCGIMNG